LSRFISRISKWGVDPLEAQAAVFLSGQRPVPALALNQAFGFEPLLFTSKFVLPFHIAGGQSMGACIIATVIRLALFGKVI